MFNWHAGAEQAGSIGRITKLAIASIVAAPFDLSPGDLAQLHEMDYEGQEDVANRIASATIPLLSSLPMPLPFQQKI